MNNQSPLFVKNLTLGVKAFSCKKKKHNERHSLCSLIDEEALYKNCKQSFRATPYGKMI